MKLLFYQFDRCFNIFLPELAEHFKQGSFNLNNFRKNRYLILCHFLGNNSFHMCILIRKKKCFLRLNLGYFLTWKLERIFQNLLVYFENVFLEIFKNELWWNSSFFKRFDKTRFIFIRKCLRIVIFFYLIV